MYAALDGLSDGMRASLRKLRAVHDFGHANRTIFAQRADGGTLTAEQQASTPPMEHPVVRRHPVTGREALFVNPGFTERFADMTPEESRPLLDYLFEQATDPAIVYRHRWRVGDLVFWDNQSNERCSIVWTMAWDIVFNIVYKIVWNIVWMSVMMKICFERPPEASANFFPT